jgi:hypothetical protein
MMSLQCQGLGMASPRRGGGFQKLRCAFQKLRCADSVGTQPRSALSCLPGCPSMHTSCGGHLLPSTLPIVLRGSVLPFPAGPGLPITPPSLPPWAARSFGFPVPETALQRLRVSSGLPSAALPHTKVSLLFSSYSTWWPPTLSQNIFLP